MQDERMTELRGSRGRIVLHEWSGDRPRWVALIAHGYGEHAGRYAHVAEHLVRHGGAVYAPDHLGHGRSEGERALVERVDDVVDDLHAVARNARGEHPSLPVVLIGHSMGGIVATRYAQLHGGELAALVLSGPAIGANPLIEGVLAMDPLPEVPIDPSALSRDPAVGRAYADDPLVWHGPFRRATLEALFAAARASPRGRGSGACRRSGSTATTTRSCRWPRLARRWRRSAARSRVGHLSRRAPRGLQRDEPRGGARGPDRIHRPRARKEAPMTLDTHGLAEALKTLGQTERRIVGSFVRRHAVARDPNEVFDEQQTFGQRVADRVAAFGGSWTFIFLFLATMAFWMLVNEERRAPFDPFPFILLNLVLSCVAALQAPVIMMSQNRQAAKDRVDASHDYEVNLKAEMEVMALHGKMDELREQQWSSLIAIQEEQLAALREIRALLAARQSSAAPHSLGRRRSAASDQAAERPRVAPPRHRGDRAARSSVARLPAEPAVRSFLVVSRRQRHLRRHARAGARLGHVHGRDVRDRRARLPGDEAEVGLRPGGSFVPSKGLDASHGAHGLPHLLALRGDLRAQVRGRGQPDPVGARPTRTTSSRRATSARRASPSPTSTTTPTGCAGRCGGTRPGSFEEISWDEAFDLVGEPARRDPRAPRRRRDRLLLGQPHRATTTARS